MIEIRLDDLAKYARSQGWVTVCRLPALPDF
jgi:hypothetical protein